MTTTPATRFDTTPFEQSLALDLRDSNDDVCAAARALPVATEGIKYAGSKLKLLPHILAAIDGLEVKRVIDAFSGSTRVSQALAKSGYEVVSNDHAAWSEVLATAYLMNTRPAGEYTELIDHLNGLKPVEGWFSEAYGGRDFEGSAVQLDGSKRPWQLHNTMKLDAIRPEIDRLNLDSITRSVALTSLILALDKVDSTMGHFSSYLREWSDRSYNDLVLEIPSLWINKDEHQVHQRDTIELLRQDHLEADLTYLDPPYGSNNEKMPPSRVRYLAYYHVWTTVVLNDQPELFGKAGRRSDSSDTDAASVFEEFRRNPTSGRFIAAEAIEEVVKMCPSRYVALSYSSNGRVTAGELEQILQENGKLLSVAAIDYRKNVMSDMRWTHEWTKEAEVKNQEFIFVLEKR